jgi:hypothetical protein
MRDSNKKSRRTLIIIFGLAVIGVAIVLIWSLRSRKPAGRELRHADQWRERHTPKAHTSVPGSIGIIIAFAPEQPMPDGGWRTDLQISIADAPAWLTDPSLPYVLDRAFGTMAVTVPREFFRVAGPLPVIGGVPPQAPGATPPATMPIRPNRVDTFAVRGTVRVPELPGLVQRLTSVPGFRGVFSDPPVVSDADPDVCLFPPVGTADGVAESSHAQTSGSPNPVLLAIVDLGFDFETIQVTAPDLKFNASLSFSADASTFGDPGSYPGEEHGNMCAYDATLVGAHATLVDLRVGDGDGQRLSDAEKAFNTLYAKLTENSDVKDSYDGMVLSNSWGLQSPDDQLDPAVRYFDNPNHPFTLAVKKLIAEGVDVVFSAGDSGCGAAAGTGSIWGANSLDEAISVAAVDVNKARITYSSQGPGALATAKPDFSSYAHFIGTDDGDTDTGTSASAAVVAGIVAAIRAKPGMGWKQKTPAQIKEYLISVADRQVTDSNGAPMVLTGWTRDFGFGIARVQ